MLANTATFSPPRLKQQEYQLSVHQRGITYPYLAANDCSIF